MGATAIIRGMNRLALGLSPGHWRYSVEQARAAKVRPQVTTVRCREIATADLERVIDLLTVGFSHSRTRQYWADAIHRMSIRLVPLGYPQYGYMLESDDKPVGVILLICTLIDGAVRCNESSYYVEPAFRCFAPILMKRVHRHKEITFLNVTPARHTWPMLEAQGYRKLAQGIFVTLPLLCPASDARVSTNFLDGRLTEFEIDLLIRHASYGCICVVCEQYGAVYPLIFVRRHYHGIPLAHLIYSRDQREFVRVAAAVAGLLARRGVPAVILDADGPLDLPGVYLESRKYWKGPNQPRLGDLTNTEIAIFGGF